MKLKRWLAGFLVLALAITNLPLNMLQVEAQELSAPSTDTQAVWARKIPAPVATNRIDLFTDTLILPINEQHTSLEIVADTSMFGGENNKCLKITNNYARCGIASNADGIDISVAENETGYLVLELYANGTNADTPAEIFVFTAPTTASAMYNTTAYESFSYTIETTGLHTVKIPTTSIDATTIYGVAVCTNAWTKMDGANRVYNYLDNIRVEWTEMEPTELSITKEPTAITDVVAGKVATLSVGATGSSSLKYQWYKCDGEDKSNAKKVTSMDNIPANEALYTFYPLAGTSYYYCEVSATGAEPVESQAVPVTTTATATKTGKTVIFEDELLTGTKLRGATVESNMLRLSDKYSSWWMALQYNAAQNWTTAVNNEGVLKFDVRTSAINQLTGGVGIYTTQAQTEALNAGGEDSKQPNIFIDNVEFAKKTNTVYTVEIPLSELEAKGVNFAAVWGIALFTNLSQAQGSTDVGTFIDEIRIEYNDTTPIIGITEQPMSQNVKTGTPVTLSVEAGVTKDGVAVSNPALSYKWYKKTNGGTASVVSGATSATYTFTASTAGIFDYYCVVSYSGATSVTSATATITVTAEAATKTNKTFVIFDDVEAEGFEADRIPVSGKYKFTMDGGAVLVNTDPAVVSTPIDFKCKGEGQTVDWSSAAENKGVLKFDMKVSWWADENSTYDEARKIVLYAGNQTYTLAKDWATVTTTTPTLEESAKAKYVTVSIPLSEFGSDIDYTKVQGVGICLSPNGSNGNYIDNIRVEWSDTMVVPTIGTVSIEKDIPADTLIWTGDWYELQVTSTGLDADAAVSYQWYRCDSTTRTNAIAMSGEKNAVCRASSAQAGHHYYFCRITTANGQVTKLSNVVKVLSLPIVEITSQPAATSVQIGQQATVSVAAKTVDGVALKYQWYRVTGAGRTVSRITGATDSTYNFTPIVEGEAAYYCRVFTIYDEAYKDTDNVTVTATGKSLTNGVLITQELEPELSIEVNQNVSLTVGVDPKNTGITPKYQWYRASDPESDGTVGEYKEIKGATSATYEGRTRNEGDTYYYCKVTVGNLTYTTETTKVTERKTSMIFDNALGIFKEFDGNSGNWRGEVAKDPTDVENTSNQVIKFNCEPGTKVMLRNYDDSSAYDIQKIIDCGGYLVFDAYIGGHTEGMEVELYMKDQWVGSGIKVRTGAMESGWHTVKIPIADFVAASSGKLTVNSSKIYGIGIATHDYSTDWDEESKNRIQKCCLDNIRFERVIKPVEKIFLMGGQLNLGGNIQMKMYLSIPETVNGNKNDVYFNVAQDKKEVEGQFAKVDTFKDTMDKLNLDGVSSTIGQLAYDFESVQIYNYPIPAKEMGDNITFYATQESAAGVLYESDQTVYSVLEYANSMFEQDNKDNTSYSDEAITMIKDMLNYGSTAQQLFGYKAIALANNTAHMTEAERTKYTSIEYTGAVKTKLEPFLAHHKAQGTADAARLSFISLQLESETGLKLYFKGLDLSVVETPAFKNAMTVKVNGETLDPSRYTVENYNSSTGKFCLVEISGISASELDDVFSVQFGKAYDTAQTKFEYSIMSYCAYVLEKDSNYTENDAVQLRNLCKALYQYMISAQAYQAK